MAQQNSLKRYLDAGMAFTSMTQERAEAIVRDLVRQGEVQSEQTQAAVNDILNRSRQNTEKLFSQVRREVRDQVKVLGLATQADVDRLERKIDAMGGTGSASKQSSARKSSAKRPSTKKSTAKKRSSAKKSTAKKRSSAKKSTAKKRSSAKKSTAKKRSSAKKSTSAKKGGTATSAAKKKSTGSSS